MIAVTVERLAGRRRRPQDHARASCTSILAGAILESNTNFFVGRMSQEGRTADEAQAEFAALLDLLAAVRFASSLNRSVATHVSKLRLEGNWK